MEAAFLSAALPEPVILLKQQLEPYSVGHQMLLARHGNRFVVGDIEQDPPSLEDLYMGVFVCCQTYEAASAALLSPNFDTTVANWVRQCGAFDRITLSVEFQRYIRDGSAYPGFRALQRKGQAPARTPGAPWLAILLCFLMNQLHMSLTAALNCPYGLANWLYCTHQENEGRLRIASEDDLSEEESIRAKMAELGMMPWRVGED